MSGIGLDEIHSNFVTEHIIRRNSSGVLNIGMAINSNRALIQHFAKMADAPHEEAKIDLNFVESLIRNGADINTTDKYGQTVLHEVGGGIVQLTEGRDVLGGRGWEGGVWEGLYVALAKPGQVMLAEWPEGNPFILQEDVFWLATRGVFLSFYIFYFILITFTFSCVCVCVCVCACVHVCSMHACVCACVHACMCACVRLGCRTDNGSVVSMPSYCSYVHLTPKCNTLHMWQFSSIYTSFYGFSIYRWVSCHKKVHKINESFEKKLQINT